MFTILKAILTFSFLISIVTSIPRPSAEDLNPNLDDALNTNIFLDGVSNNNDLTTSAPLTSMFDSDVTDNTNLIGSQENLFATDASTGSSCQAENSQPLPAIGRLRRRQETLLGSGAGDEQCISPTKETTDPNVDSSLLQLPIALPAPAPDISGRPEICPTWKFGIRVIALCSADNPSISTTIDNLRIRVITNAQIWNPFYGCLLLERLYCCRSVGSVRPRRLSSEKPWKITGYDCLENYGTGILIPKS